MNHLIDDVARILASPTPRRKAFKLIAAALAGGLFGSVSFGQSDNGCDGVPINTSCGNGKKCCGQFCIGAGNTDFCCSNSSRCPPSQCCSVNNGASTACCPPGTTFKPGPSCNHCL